MHSKIDFLILTFSMLDVVYENLLAILRKFSNHSNSCLNFYLKSRPQKPENRPQPTIKNARNMKSVSRAKRPYFEGIFKLWTHDHRPAITALSSNVHQFCKPKSSCFFCAKRPWNGFRFSRNVLYCLRSRSKFKWWDTVYSNYWCKGWTNLVLTMALECYAWRLQL